MNKTETAFKEGFLVLTALLILCSQVVAEEECAPSAGWNYICGPEGAEDLVQISGTRWVIASGMAEDGRPGKLHLIDTEKKAWETLYPGPEAKNEPDPGSYPACTEPPDPDSFGAHGIAIRDDGSRTGTLLAVNHGREAIEVFRISISGDKPSIRWTGCVRMEKDIFVNSVAFLPDGGMAFTKFFDPQSPSGFGSMMEGAPTGGVYEWHPETGIAPVPGTELSGANGIVVTEDGLSIYVAAWGTRELVRFTRGNGAVDKTAVKTDFAPDNLRWAPDGTILVAGQVPDSGGAGGIAGFKGWAVVTLDPETMKLNEVARDRGESPLQNASVAIDVSGVLWIGSFRSDRVAYRKRPESD